MKKGITTTIELINQIKANEAAKRDFVGSTENLEMFGDSLRIDAPGGGQFSVNENAHRQIAGRAGIPWKYYDQMRNNAAVPNLLAQNVNAWWHATPEKRRVRTLRGTARAFLSDRYRVMDNAELMRGVAPILGQHNLQVKSSQITDDRLYLKVVTPDVSYEMKTRTRGDMVYAGLLISNSETGHGAWKIETLIYRLVCQNGLVMPHGLKKYHVGKSQVDGVDDAMREIFSDDTKRITDQAFMAQVQDVVRASLDHKVFSQRAEEFQALSEGATMVKPIAAMEEIKSNFTLSDNEADLMLAHLATDGDFSRFGALNAMTRMAQDVDSYDRSTELERNAAKFLGMSERDWVKIAGRDEVSA